MPRNRQAQRTVTLGITGDSAAGKAMRLGRRQHGCHTLRPTLPNPDLTPVLDTGARNGLGWSRHGTRTASRPTCWRFPATSTTTGSGLWLRQSHPPALPQLLATDHLVKAALGHYAI